MNRTTVLAGAGFLIAAAVVWWSGSGSAGDAALSADEGQLAELTALEERLAGLEAAVHEVATFRAVLDNELQYTRGLDRHDEELIRDAYWPNAAVTYGIRRAVEELGPWANATHATRAAHQHHVTGLSLDVEADMAHEEGYILFSADLQRDVSFDTAGMPTPGRVVAGSKATLGTGRYVNRYERRNGEWKMAVHEYVHDLSVLLEPVDLCATSCLGRWDTSDISYLRPLRPLSPEERRQRADRGKLPSGG